MPIFLLTAARYLGVTGCVALAIVVFYEGLPLGPIRYIPYLGPALAGIADGRVDREREAAVEGLVTKVELDAEKAKADEYRRQVEAGRIVIEAYEEIARNALKKEELEDVQDTQDRREYEAKLDAEGRSCGLSQSDIDWLQRH